MLYLIGLGLGDVEDVTCKGLAVIRQANRVYLEAYTSILTVGTDALVSKTVTVNAFKARLGKFLVAPSS